MSIGRMRLESIFRLLGLQAIAHVLEKTQPIQPHRAQLTQAQSAVLLPTITTVPNVAACNTSAIATASSTANSKTTSPTNTAHKVRFYAAKSANAQASSQNAPQTCCLICQFLGVNNLNIRKIKVLRI